jgi:hypothetical protein
LHYSLLLKEPWKRGRLLPSTVGRRHDEGRILNAVLLFKATADDVPPSLPFSVLDSRSFFLAAQDLQAN